MTFIEQSQPEAEEREHAAMVPAKVYPCDTAIRARVMAALENGLTISELARGSSINKTICVQYCNAAGNSYPGTIDPYERRMENWLEKRDLEFLAGIETVETDITKQVASLLRAVHRQRIMGKAIGGAGLGKTRAVAWLGAKDPSLCTYFISRQTGTLESVRSNLFKTFGVRGGAKTYGRSALDKYRELIKRIRGADVTFLFDQAHMLSLPALDWLCEVWNATKRPQLFVATDKLLDKLERDEQIASRIEFGDMLAPPEDCRPLIQHQIKAMLPELNGELGRLTALCEKLAVNGRFRRVEMRLGNMLYLSEKPSCKNKTWCELFEMAAAFSQDNTGN